MKRHIQLTEAQRRDLKQRKKTEIHTKIYKRLLFIELKDKGMKNTEILRLLDISIDTCTDWTTIFLTSGFQGLSTLSYAGRRVPKLEPYTKKITQYVQNNSIPNLAFLQHWIQETYNITIGVSWLCEYCKKNSIYLIKKQDLSQANQQQK